jgi:sugar phosphate permease
MSSLKKSWLIWGLAAFYFFADYFARVSPGVMSRELQLAFSVSAGGLGALSAYFYYPYLAMQLPVGLIVDRYNIRNLLTIMALVTALGCVGFGAAPNLIIACLSRAVIGFSAAFAFVSALRLAAMWFPIAMFGMLAGLTQAMGMLGAAVGEAPVSLLVTSIGWRETMYVMAVVFFFLAGLIFKFVQVKPNSQVDTTAHQGQSWWQILCSLGHSLKRVFLNRQVVLASLCAGLIYAPSAVIGEFWGPAFLQYGRGLSAHNAAFANGLIFIGWVLGGPIFGWFSDKLQKRKLFLFLSAACGSLFMGLIIFMPSLSVGAIYLLFFCHGLTNFGVIIAYTMVSECSDKSVLGTALAFSNMFSVIIGALLQPILGQFIDWYVGGVNDIANLSLANFQVGFSLLPVCAALAILVGLFLKEHPQKP